MELLSLKRFSKDAKSQLLNELGFSTDGTFVLDDKGNKVIDKYINENVRIDNMLILPGSTIILDDNPVSIASYLEDYGEMI